MTVSQSNWDLWRIDLSRRSVVSVLNFCRELVTDRDIDLIAASQFGPAGPVVHDINSALHSSSDSFEFSWMTMHAVEAASYGSEDDISLGAHVFAGLLYIEGILAYKGQRESFSFYTALLRIVKSVVLIDMLSTCTVYNWIRDCTYRMSNADHPEGEMASTSFMRLALFVLSSSITCQAGCDFLDTSNKEIAKLSEHLTRHGRGPVTTLYELDDTLSSNDWSSLVAGTIQQLSSLQIQIAKQMQIP